MELLPCAGCSQSVTNDYVCPICSQSIHIFCGRRLRDNGDPMHGEPVICPRCDEEKNDKPNLGSNPRSKRSAEKDLNEQSPSCETGGEGLNAQCTKKKAIA